MTDESNWVYLRKRGYFYRPNWKGYTASHLEAGVYHRSEAEWHMANTEGVSIAELSQYKEGRGDG